MDLVLQAKLRTRFELRRRGYTRTEINDLVDAVDADVVAAAVTMSGVSVPAEEDPSPGPKKSFWERLKEWIQSPEGKAFISMVIQIILSAFLATKEDPTS